MNDPAPLDRHTQDFLVCAQDLVTHGDDGPDRGRPLEAEQTDQLQRVPTRHDRPRRRSLGLRRIRAIRGLHTPQATTITSVVMPPLDVRTPRTRPPSTSIPVTSVLASTVSAPRRWPIEDGQISPNAMAAGDLNGDGRTDLILLAEDHVYFFAQKPDHTLAEPLKIPFTGPGGA